MCYSGLALNHLKVPSNEADNHLISLAERVNWGNMAVFTELERNTRVCFGRVTVENTLCFWGDELKTNGVEVLSVVLLVLNNS